MAFNGKYVRVEYIIERVRQDYKFKDINFNESIEWIYDALAHIGVPYTYKEKITDGNGDNDDPLEVSSYKTLLPVDLYELIHVKDYDTDIPLLESGSPFYNREDYNENIVQYSYQLRDNYLHTDMEEGELVLVYSALPTDERGYPLIADDVRYIRGVISFVAERYAFGKYLSKELDERRYNLVAQEYSFNIASAGTSLHIPSLDKMEAMKNRALRLYSREDFHDTGFRDFHRKEDIDRGTKY